MITIAPFKALRPQAQYAKQVASRPYDVLNTKEAKAEAAGNPFSFLHITKSEIDLPEDTDIHSEQVYSKAKENLHAFLQRDVLFQESKPCYYIYELTMHGRAQTGLVCCSAIKDYEKGLIKKHEFTRPEKELDRINHITKTGAQTGNVFLAYRAVAAIDALILQWKQEKSPVYDFVAEDDIQHRIWVVNDDHAIRNITELFKTSVPASYIADGHHRAASAAKVHAALGDQSTLESRFFLTTLFPANQLAIMDYNRLVTDLNGMDDASFLEKINSDFDVTPEGNKPVKPSAPHQFGMYLSGSWYKLQAKQGSYTNDPTGVLDVTILQNNLLHKVLGRVEQESRQRRNESCF